MAITIVMGVPGAGKSTVLAAAAEKNNCLLVNYGDLMFEIAEGRRYVSHRDNLRKLPPERQKLVQSEVGDKLAGMGRDIILDTHCSIATQKGYLPGLPLSLLSKLDVKQLVLIIAPIPEIIARRGSDATRARDSESPESLTAHEDWNKYLLAAYSMATGAPAKIIVNENGKLKAAQDALLSLLD